MMKKALLPVFLGLVCGVFLEAQTLDEAVLRAALKIGADLPAGATAAVVHFRSGSETLGDYVINELHGALLRNRRVTPIKPDESQSQSVRGEPRFNKAGEIDAEAVQSIGRLLGAQYVITGSLERNDSGYEILFTAVDAEGGETRSRYSAAVNPNDAKITSLSGGAPLFSAPGSLEIQAVTAGTAEITGEDVRRTAEIPAGRRLPVGSFNGGTYRVAVRYGDGKTEEKTVEIRPSQTVRLRFNYRPPRPRIPLERLNTLGASVGSAFGPPLVTVTVQGTVAPWKGSFFDLGADIGFGSGTEGVGHFSLYPYARYAFFLPFAKAAGWYVGAGPGVMISTFTFPLEGKVTGAVFAADVSTGFIFKNGITVSYTLRTDFAALNHKAAVGWSYRFKQKEASATHTEQLTANKEQGGKE